jgi:hypothetical protein
VLGAADISLYAEVHVLATLTLRRLAARTVSTGKAASLLLEVRLALP